jgi:tetratricopeptide (TPR) repeat protein
MVSLNPDGALAHYWLSKGLEMTGRKQAALKERRIAADLDPRSLAMQYAAARALQDGAQHKTAIMYFERIMPFDADYQSTWFWLAFAYQKTGQSELAIDAYNQLLRLHPNDVQGHFNLAFELMLVGDCRVAATHFIKVLDLQPENREARLHLSECYKRLDTGTSSVPSNTR